MDTNIVINNMNVTKAAFVGTKTKSDLFDGSCTISFDTN